MRELTGDMQLTKNEIKNTQVCPTSEIISGFLLGGGGGGGQEGAFAPPLKVLPPLSQRDLPHILPDVFSCYPPRFLICAVRHPLSSFLK